MKKFKLTKLAVVAIIVIIFGLVPFFHGITFIWSQTNIETIHTDDTQFTLGEMKSERINPTFESKDAVVGEIIIDFPRTIFEGDTVDVTLTATKVMPNIKQIIMFVTAVDAFDASEIKSEEQLNYEISLARNRVIELLPTQDPAFKKTQSIPFLIPNEKITIKGFAISNDNFMSSINIEETLFTIYPEMDRLQAETNEKIQRQIEETRLATQEQQKTNSTFLGFAWIGVSIPLILAGVDILLRIHFDNKNN